MITPRPSSIDVKSIVTEWLSSRRRQNKISRNTIAVGIVVLDHFLKEGPSERGRLFSSGGELRGSRSGLSNVLKRHGIPSNFLKEATTRQAHQDARVLAEALDYGKSLAKLEEASRQEQLEQGIEVFRAEANLWLSKQPIKISCDREQSPAVWIASIFEKARGRSGGIVEQHLVGAKLQRRHPDIRVPNHPSHAADLQTGRTGDFTLKETSYHVTATDGKEAIQRCKENIESGVHPVLLVPRQLLVRASVHAENAGIQNRLSLLALEDFITQNIIELSTAGQADFFATLKTIVDEYNRRLEEVETDLSLKIEIS